MSRGLPREHPHTASQMAPAPQAERRSRLSAGEPGGGLARGAALEVDVVLTADGHAVCLHDLSLDSETTGKGLVAEASRAEIERLQQRGHDGTPLPSAPCSSTRWSTLRAGWAPPHRASSSSTSRSRRAASWATAWTASSQRWTTWCPPSPSAAMTGRRSSAWSRRPGLRAGFDQGFMASACPRTTGFDTPCGNPGPGAHRGDLFSGGQPRHGRLAHGVNLVELVSAKGRGRCLDRGPRPRLAPAAADRCRLPAVRYANDPLALAPIVAEIVA